jgi:Trypsin-like peptidase domain
VRVRSRLIFRCACLTLASVSLAACGGTSTEKAATTQPATTLKRVPKPKPVTLRALVAKVRSGVVRVDVLTCDEEAFGTGFLLGPRLVATVEHVIDGALAIRLVRAGKPVGTATVIGSDASRDLALLRTSRPIRGYTFALERRSPALGEDVAVLGFPLGLPLSVSRGLVSGSDRTIPIDGINRRKLVQTDAAVNHGNSGGPLISLDNGRVVGLVDLGSTEANGLAFAVSAQVAAPLFQAWRVSPQPIASAPCSQGATSQAAPPPQATSTPSAPSAATYSGHDYTILYPSTWTIESDEAQKGGYTDTTIRDPSDSRRLLRIDVSDKPPPSDALAAAMLVVNSLRRQSGYQELALTRTTFNGYDAAYWEFVVPERGVPVHKVDLFFINEYGEGVAILTQTPATQWQGAAAAFKAVRDSYTTS